MDKIAIFGGTFDPIHLGHTACLKHLIETNEFAKVYLVPTNVNPLKTGFTPATAEHRLAMIKVALSDYLDDFAIDTAELAHEGPSYTWDTLQRYSREYSSEQLYLCVGIDVFETFDQWKNFAQILEICNLLVLSRPPFQRPFLKEDFPAGVQPYIHSYERGFCLLKTNRHIEFVKVLSNDISSSVIRKCLKTGKSVDKYLSLEVEKYIVEEQVYPRITPGEVDFSELTLSCGAELNQYAMNTMGYDLTGLDKLYDYTLVASATSTKAAQSLAQNLKKFVKEEYGLSPFGEEGYAEGRWVILDYGALIIHIFYDFVRHEYHLEQLWAAAARIKLPKKNET